MQKNSPHPSVNAERINDKTVAHTASVQNPSIINTKRQWNKVTITYQEFIIPFGALLEITDILLDEEMQHKIIGTETGPESLVFEIEWKPDQWHVIQAFEEIIAECEQKWYKKQQQKKNKKSLL